MHKKDKNNCQSRLSFIFIDARIKGGGRMELMGNFSAYYQDSSIYRQLRWRNVLESNKNAKKHYLLCKQGISFQAIQKNLQQWHA